MKNSRVLFLFGVTLLVGCQKELPKVEAEGEKRVLTFNTRVDGSFSRSSRAYSGDIEIINTGFTTIGYKTQGLFSIDDAAKLPAPNVFNAPDTLTTTPLKEITIQGAKYQTELPQITHEDGSHLSFFAWAQAAGSNGITATTDSYNHKGYPWIDVTVALPSETQRDVVGANTMNLPNEYVVSAVDLDFKHLLSKLTFKIKAPQGATATVVSTTAAFGADKVYHKGRFTFNNNDSVGKWSGLNTYWGSTVLTPTGWQTPALTSGNTELLGELLILPQKVVDGFLSLTLTYTLSIDGVTSEDQVRTLSLRAADLVQGRNYVYTLLVNADEMSLFNVSIAPWIDGETGSLPLIPGPKGDVVLLLDGNEPPYTHTDGKQYWLDASGWNNHCLIENSISTTGQISYDAENKGYLIPTTSSNLTNHIRIPNLGSIAGDFSFEVVCKNDKGESADPYPFILTRKMVSANQPAINSDVLLNPNIAYFSNQMQFKYGRPSYSENIAMDLGTIDHTKRFYAYGSRKASDLRVVMGCNNTHFLSCTNKANSSSNGTQTIEGGYIGPAFKGTIHYLKITKQAIPDEQFVENYQTLASKFAITRVPHDETNDHTRKPANCYWANFPTQNKIKFNPTLKPIKGSGSQCNNVTNSGVADGNENIQAVDIAWQTRTDHGIGSGSSFINTYWYDKTTNTCVVGLDGAGNGVMTGKNSSGTVRWTYHIWGINGGWSDVSNGGTTLMSTYLGGLASTGSKPSTSDAYKYYGLMFQWGSKQPIIGQGNSTTAGKYADILDWNGNQISGNTNYGGFRYQQATAADYMQIMADPLLIRGSNHTYIAKKFLGWTPGNKTLFDPCPYGYRVASMEALKAFGMDGATSYSAGIAGGFMRSGLWWPATGGRNILAAWESIGQQVRLWTANSHNDDDARYRWCMLVGPGGDFHWASSSDYNGLNGAQSGSRPIRCIKSNS